MHDEHESYKFDEKGDDTVSRHSKGKQTTENGIPNGMGMWN